MIIGDRLGLDIFLVHGCFRVRLLLETIVLRTVKMLTRSAGSD